VTTPKPRRIAVTGSTGLIGSALVRALRADGREVMRVVRREATAPNELEWDPTNDYVDLAKLDGVEAVAHFAGAGVGDRRWSESYKRTIRESRVLGTRTLANALASLERPPATFICGSAIGFYGDTGDREVDESAPQGPGFLADVVREWEGAADPARTAGIRVVHPRSGLVASKDGGAWGRLIPIFKLGGGGRLGSGAQYWSYISLRDEISALMFLIDNASSDDGALDGPFNLTAPRPVTNREVTAAMGRVLHRPTLLPVPEFALRIVLGEFSSEVLGSIRAVPTRLLAAGFVFEDDTIDAAITAALQ